MRLWFIKKFGLRTLPVDEWKAFNGTLPPEEIKLMRTRRWANCFYFLLRELIMLPVTVLRTFLHLIDLARELDRLHYGPLRKIQHGTRCVIDKQTWLINGHNIRLGHNVKVSAFSSLMAGNVSTIEIGNNTIIGPGVTIVAFNHGTEISEVPFRFQPWEDAPHHSIYIGANVWIGAQVVVLPGTVIEEHSIIGAGVIVRGTIPARSVLVNRRENRIISNN